MVSAFLCQDVEILNNVARCSQKDSPWSALIKEHYEEDYSSITYLVFQSINQSTDKSFDFFLKVFTPKFIQYRDQQEKDNDKIVEVSAQLNYMMFRQKFWANLLIKRATQRLIYLERENDGDSLRLLSGAYILIPPDSIASAKIGNVKPSDQTSFFHHLIPDQFGVDAVQTGVNLAWTYEPKYRIKTTYNGSYEFGAALHMQIKDQSTERVDYINLWAGTRFLQPSPFISSYGVSLSVNKNIRNTSNFGNDVMIGGEFNVGFLADKLRLSIGTRDMINSYSGEDWSVQLVITNIDEIFWAFY